MAQAEGISDFFHQIGASFRVVVATMVICCLLYTSVILFIAQTVMPQTANGSLIFDDCGEIIGSKSLAQGFISPKYFWPRPSAVHYDASSTGGSNLSPTNPELRERAKEILIRLNLPQTRLIPADLVTASGSGMDPSITLRSATIQANRVAAARELPLTAIMDTLAAYAQQPGYMLTSEPLVNVLLVNIALDRIGQ